MHRVYFPNPESEHTRVITFRDSRQVISIASCGQIDPARIHIRWKIWFLGLLCGREYGPLLLPCTQYRPAEKLSVIFLFREHCLRAMRLLLIIKFGESGLHWYVKNTKDFDFFVCRLGINSNTEDNYYVGSKITFLSGVRLHTCQYFGDDERNMMFSVFRVGVRKIFDDICVLWARYSTYCLQILANLANFYFSSPEHASCPGIGGSGLIQSVSMLPQISANNQLILSQKLQVLSKPFDKVLSAES